MHDTRQPGRSDRYKKWRSPLLWILFFGTLIAVGALLYKELTTPLRPPDITGIANNVPPQTEPPTADVKASYTVPAQNPKYLIIPKININTNIYPVGLTKEKAIAAPDTAWGVGWYQDGARPGSGKGAALIDGHVNDAFNTPGVFYELSSVTAGDEVTIVRGDDSRLNYRVITVTKEPLKNIEMERVLRSVDPTKEGLNLITCGGSYDKSTQSYTDRVVVYTVRVS
jgi:LPXTG-site transpeptidase (sortase) family protein